MARHRTEGAPVESNVFHDNRYSTRGTVITGTLTLAAGDATVQIVSAAAPQVVKLPPLVAEGQHYVISAITSTLTIQDSAAGALSPATTIAAGKTTSFYSARIPASGVLTWFIQNGA